jgi:hypothetical protein
VIISQSWFYVNFYLSRICFYFSAGATKFDTVFYRLLIALLLSQSFFLVVSFFSCLAKNQVNTLGFLG